MNVKAADRIKRRVAAGKVRNPSFFDFMDRQDTAVTKVKCRRSGCALRSLADSGTDEIRKINGKDVTIKRQILVTTPEYSEMTIEMLEPDGTLSTHVTPISKTAKAGPWTVAELEDLYAADLEEWRLDGAGEDYLDIMEQRKPVRVI